MTGYKLRRLFIEDYGKNSDEYRCLYFKKVSAK